MTHDESPTQGRGTARPWSLIDSVLICTKCHPPAAEALVIGWVGEEQ